MQFEVFDAAIEKDSEFIPDISVLWTSQIGQYQFIKQFLDELKMHRAAKSDTISSQEEVKISNAIGQLYNLKNYPFAALQLSSTVSDEQVAEIFVRINSKGVQLNQADFILTLLSVFWDQGRADLEQFSRLY